MTNIIPEKTADINADLLKDIARLKGQPAGEAKPQPMSVLYPVSAAVWLKAEKEALKNPVSGQRMPDGSVYLGKYWLDDPGDKSLTLEFNVFAAKEDLPDGPRTYNDTVKYMSQLKGWNGHDGAGYKNDKGLYRALREGTYDGKWIIPTIGMLNGGERNAEAMMPDNIIARNKVDSAFKETFKKDGLDGNDAPHWYWSSSEAVRKSIYNVCPYSHFFLYDDDKDRKRLSCRPVRLVPCKGP